MLDSLSLYQNPESSAIDHHEKMPSDVVSYLHDLRDQLWANILEKHAFFDFVANQEFDRRLYGIFLVETFHYVRHNPKHQALVAAYCNDAPVGYQQFCYEHAQEETGHELMALHDLSKLGLAREHIKMGIPLASTEAFIAYLYYVSQHGNSLRRLGYSFWAEDSYQYVMHLLDKIRVHLNLEDSQMTFLVSHATIDEKHSDDINKMVTTYCKSKQDLEAIEQVLQKSLELNSMMLDSVLSEYMKLVNKESDKYGFLNALLIS